MRPNLSTVIPYTSEIAVPAIINAKSKGKEVTTAMPAAVPPINSAARALGAKDLRYIPERRGVFLPLLSGHSEKRGTQ